MTIESASHPSPPLSEWDGGNPEQPYYLEIFGETTPLVDTSYSEVVPSGSSATEAQAASSAPVYEYW